MKRHAALQQHSREHHIALKMARLARFAADSGAGAAIDQAAADIAEHYLDLMEAHFQDEEEGILQQLKAIGQDELVARTLAEHVRLRQLGEALKQPDAATLTEFGTLLTDHVRFEERELFEKAQEYPAFAAG